MCIRDRSVTALVTVSDSCGGTLDCVAGSIVTNGCQRTQVFTLVATGVCTNQSAPCLVTNTWKVDSLVFSPQPFTDCSGSVTNFLGCNPVLSSIPGCSVAIHATSSCGAAPVTCSLVQTTNSLTCLRTRVVTYTATDGCFTNTC